MGDESICALFISGIVLAIATISSCYSSGEPTFTEWRQFPVPYGTNQTERPTDAEFLKILPLLRPEPKLDKTAEETGVAVWWGDYSVQIFEEQPPLDQDLVRKPMIQTPAGEDEPLVMGLWGTKDTGMVSVTIENAPFLVDIRNVEFAPRKVPGPYNGDEIIGGREVGFATYLSLKQMGEVKAKKNTVFWINFTVPSETQAGRYPMTLLLTLHKQQKIIRFPVTVHVLDYRIPPANIAYGMYFRPFESEKILPSRYRTAELMRKYWRDMARHGMTSATIYHRGIKYYSDKHEVFLNEHPDILMLKEMMQEGLVREKIPIIFLDTNGIGTDEHIISLVKGELKERHMPEFLYYGPDEPGINEHILSIFLKLQPLRKHFKVATAMNDHAARYYADFLDVWIIHDGQITPEIIKLSAEKKTEIWTYDCKHRGRGNAPWSRFYAGLYTWALRLKGNFLWSYTEGYYWEKKHNAIFCYVLPSLDGPVPSIEWELRREGVEDYRTLTYLESLISAYPDNHVTKEASKWLEIIRSRVDFYVARNMPPSLYPWDGPELYPMCPNFEPSELSSVRENAARYILALKSLTCK